MKEWFFSGTNEPSPALPDRQGQADVHGKIQRIKGLLAVLQHDFEMAGAMRWTLFKQRVDPLIHEIETLLRELHRQAPDTPSLKPLRRQLRTYMHARLQGPDRRL